MTGYALFLVLLRVGFRRAVAVTPPGNVRDSLVHKAPAGPSVSVIIAARNEEHSITDCLEAILASHWPDLEVLVVDDESEDATRQRVERVAAGHPEHRIRAIPSGRDPAAARGHKKHAITTGVLHAKGDIILQTDADCEPGPEWVEAMVAHFDGKAGMVAGPIAFKPDEGFFAGFQALEMLGFVGIAAGGIGLDHPVLCNAANMGYRREVFLEVGGFDGLDHLSSGDDELLMHKIHRHSDWEVRACTRPESLVLTPPQEDLSDFLEQRRRWGSKGMHYPQKAKVALSAMIFAAFLFLIGLSVATAVSPGLWPFLVATMLVKVVGEWLLLHAAATHFGRSRLLKWLVPGQPFQLVYLVTAVIAGSFAGFTWKGRILDR